MKQDDHNQLKWEVRASKLFQGPAHFQGIYHTFKLFLIFCFLMPQILIFSNRVFCFPLSHPSEFSQFGI